MSWLSTQLKVSPLSSSCIRGKKRILKFKVLYQLYSTLSQVNPTVTRLHFGGRDLTKWWCELCTILLVITFVFGKMWLVQLPWPHQNCAKLVRLPQEGVPGNRWHATISYSNLWPQYFQGWVSEGQTGSSSTSLASSVAFWDCAG